MECPGPCMPPSGGCLKSALHCTVFLFAQCNAMGRMTSAYYGSDPTVIAHFQGGLMARRELSESEREEQKKSSSLKLVKVCCRPWNHGKNNMSPRAYMENGQGEISLEKVF